MYHSCEVQYTHSWHEADLVLAFTTNNLTIVWQHLGLGARQTATDIYPFSNAHIDIRERHTQYVISMSGTSGYRPVHRISLALKS